ncbi:hypothetical protein DPMN_024117 [Dreissena polymorpha]|uniref:Uncharacterized protein n=1 Tax=Dreissena polymorpha TaxID=45954 RepID=A0A9D4LMD3_DREPO|nr:hypothetical protein DPMN_024117 [Dreissena polymorpha]
MKDDQYQNTFKCNSVSKSSFHSIFDNAIQAPIVFDDNLILAQCTLAADTYINVESLPKNTHSPSQVSSKVHILLDTPCSSIITYICDSCLNYPSSPKTRHCRHTQPLQSTPVAQTDWMFQKAKNPYVSDDTISNLKDCQPNAFTAATLPGSDGDDVHRALPNSRSRTLPPTPLHAIRPFLKV